MIIEVAWLTVAAIYAVTLLVCALKANNTQEFIASANAISGNIGPVMKAIGKAISNK